MAGGKLTASAHFGPAWAEITFGADGIVYFDPFRFEVEAYASISAGVTIDLWLGEITISVSLGASIMLAGPKFHGVAEFDVGPITITVPFGDSSQSEKVCLPWDQFVRKYLEEASPGVARVLSAIPGKGALPPGTGPGGQTDTATADGSADKPFEVLCEFELTVTTNVPTQTVKIAALPPQNIPPSSIIGVAPVGVSAANTRLVLNLFDSVSTDRLATLHADITQGGAFPVGVWGPPQPDEDRKVPAGDVIQAVDGVHFLAQASLQGTLPSEIKYNQVFAPGPRKPLPFVNIQANRASFLAAANDLSSILPPAVGGPAAYAAAKPWLRKGGSSNTAVAAIERERSAPPRLGSLTQDLAPAEAPTPAIKFPSPITAPPIDYFVHPPRAIAVMTTPMLAERAPVGTTVKDQTIGRVMAPTIQAVQAQWPAAIAARLVQTAAPASRQETTVIATGATPLTRVARGSVAAVAARGAPLDSQIRLGALTAALGGTPSSPVAAALAAAPDPAAQELQAGEVAVLQLPNAIRDADPASPRPSLQVNGGARLVAFSHGGEVLFDGAGTPNGTVIPMGSERIAVLALGDSPTGAPGLLGWHSGQEISYVGWSTAIVAGAVLRAEGASVRPTSQRFRAGWIHAADLITGTNIIATRFAQFQPTIAIVIDDPQGADTERGLSLAIDGADRALGPDGKAVPPTVVVAGNRSVLIYSLSAPAAGIPPVPGPITISVASQSNWHVAGVMATADLPAALADRVTRFGLDAIVQPLVSSHGGSVQLQWFVPQPSGYTEEPRAVAAKPAAKTATKKAAKKAPVKRSPKGKA
jgi:hypothetical protein